MDNLTQTQSIVKPDVPPAPMAGHKVVVFENTMGRMILRAILNPGDSPFKKKFTVFSTPPTYICYAVNSPSKLNFDFSVEIMLAAQHQSFTLKCSVYYHISNPEPIAIQFTNDPIRRIQEEIEKRLQQKVLQSKIQLEEIQDHFYDLCDKIRPPVTVSQIRDFAATYGVIIDDIDLTIYKIPNKFLAPKIIAEDHFLKKETAFIEEEETKKKRTHEIETKHHEFTLKDLDNQQEGKNTLHQQEVEDTKAFHEIRREIPKRVLPAMDKAIETIDGPSSFVNVADGVFRVLGQAGKEIQDSNPLSTENQLISSQLKSLAPAINGPMTDVKSYLLKLLALVENSSLTPTERRPMLACITHLLAEIQLEEQANSEVVDKYLQELNQHAVKNMKIFNRSVMEQIRELQDTVNDAIRRHISTAENPSSSTPTQSANT